MRGSETAKSVHSKLERTGFGGHGLVTLRPLREKSLDSSLNPSRVQFLKTESNQLNNILQPKSVISDIMNKCKKVSIRTRRNLS
jgi:hypothetical protein